MLVNIVFFALLLPFEVMVMKWLIKILIQDFKNLED